MQLKEFINYHVETIGPEDTLQQAAEKMRDFDIGSIPVCDDNRLLGMVTDRDITIRAAANGDDPTITTVSEVMTPDVVCCYEHQTVEEAAALMQQHQIRRLFVLNENDELIGITSLGELATATGNRQLAGETLERVSDSAEVPPEREQDLSDPEEEPTMGDGAVAAETRVTGLFGDSEQAREAVEDLKDAGFADDRIAVAMQDSAAQDNFIAETKVHMAVADEIPSIPELDGGQVLLLVDAADLAALALEIINRNQGVTGG
ncbi:MAG: CBS domain-containing protein, partial [Candidatus Binatia bacterium]